MVVLALRGGRPEGAALILSGDLSGAGSTSLQLVTADLIRRGQPSLRIHAAKVCSMDRDACLALEAARQRAELLGGRVWLVRPSRPVRDACRSAGTPRLLDAQET
jgi:anti-anti-sigma regulatory factor